MILDYTGDILQFLNTNNIVYYKLKESSGVWWQSQR